MSSKRDSSPKRAHLSEIEFKTLLRHRRPFNELTSTTVKARKFITKIPNKGVWDTFVTCYAECPTDWLIQEDKHCTERPVFEVLVDALLYQKQEKLAFAVIVEANVEPQSILLGLMANGSLKFYNKVVKTMEYKEVTAMEKQIQESLWVPVHSMELYDHFHCWGHNVDAFINKHGACDLLHLVLNIWSCFQIQSVLYCQFLIDKFNERTLSGESLCAATFAESVRQYSRRWEYARESKKYWGHEKAEHLVNLIDRYGSVEIRTLINDTEKQDLSKK